MIPVILPGKKFAAKGKPFNKLVAYVEKEQDKERMPGGIFDDILNYAASPLNKSTAKEKCIAIRTHAITKLSRATEEMNTVAKQSKCEDPSTHIILSWRDYDKVTNDQIFDAAEHTLAALGLRQHQYVIAIHADTDNLHCHIAVNRVHPKTLQATHLEWSLKTIHLAARQSEIKHGWSHDNGIYIVEIDGHGKKSIVINPDKSKKFDKMIGYVHPEFNDEEQLAAWHDSEGLESWLKSDVARALKRTLPRLKSWADIHSWLGRYGIELKDTGGGGMRVYATSSETGEILDLPASKAFRFLKRADLEKKWGAYKNDEPYQTIVPDLTHLNPKQIQKGVEHVLRRSLDRGIPPDNLIHVDASRRRIAAQRVSGLHELPLGDLDIGRQNGEVLLPDALHVHVGDEQTWQDPNLRRPGTGSTRERSSRSLTRDESKRAERKQQRAAARADLRQRFSQYRRFVKKDDLEYLPKIKEIQTERLNSLKAIRAATKEEKRLIKATRNLSVIQRIQVIAEINYHNVQLKLQVESTFQQKRKELEAIRQPPLSWRAWLYEQACLYDQAALSALRGLVYQAQKDAKKNSTETDFHDEAEAVTKAEKEDRYKRILAKLLKEEREEIAIRAARSNFIRQYEVDSLLAKYDGIQWNVTNNGHVEYSDHTGHLFTDRGNRVTFDRELVSDEDIRLALIHSRNKFGNQLTLTGDDPIFTARMARLADDMGMKILNPEMTDIIEAHRATRGRSLEAAPLETDTNTPENIPKAETEKLSHANEAQGKQDEHLSVVEQLMAKVRTIDPRAQFVIPDITSSQNYSGPVAATLELPETAFAQHTGRSIYVLHTVDAPVEHNNATVQVTYQEGKAVIEISKISKGKNELG